MSIETESFDLDGLLFTTQHNIQLGAIKGFLLKGIKVYRPPEQIPTVIRAIDETPVSSWTEKLSLYFHSKRKVKTGVPEFLHMRQTDKYGNTGRSNKRAWVEMTEHALDAGKIRHYLLDVFYKPYGMSSTVSKGAALYELCKTYERVRHYDDNPADVLRLAPLLPSVEFVVVEDKSAGVLFSRVEMSQYPNVTRIAYLGEPVRSL